MLTNLQRNGIPYQEAHDIFHESIRNVFDRFESLIKSHVISNYYGLSTNPLGCFWSVTGRRNIFEAPSLARLISDAKVLINKPKTKSDLNLI